MRMQYEKEQQKPNMLQFKLQPGRRAKTGQSSPYSPYSPAEPSPFMGHHSQTGNRNSQRLANPYGIPEPIKTQMENAFQTDFSNVTVTPNSSRAPQLGALAYTQGNNIHFAPGMYNPHTSVGQRLLGHELTHVMQQKEGRVKPTVQMNGGVTINEDTGLEKEANVMGQKAIRFLNLAGSPRAVEPFNEPGGNSRPHKQSPVNGPIQGVFNKVKGKIYIDRKNKKLYVEEEQTGATSIMKELGTGTIFTQDRSSLRSIQLYIDSDTDNFYRFICQHKENLIMQRLTDLFQVLVDAQGFGPIDGDQEKRDIRLNKATYKIEDPDRDTPMDITTFTQGSESIVYYPGETQRPELETNFTANVLLVPIDKGQISYFPPSTNVEMEELPSPEQRYAAGQLWVDNIRIGNQERPPTRFYPKQESHTSSWTLVREAIMSKNNQTFGDFLKVTHEEFNALRKHNDEETSVIEILNMVPEGYLENLQSEFQPIDIWQSIASRLIEIQVRAYQLASSATFKRGTPLYHNEATAMEMLRNNETAIRQNRGLVNTTAELSKAVGCLLDVQFNLSLGKPGYAIAVQDWLDHLSISFPALMKAEGATIVASQLEKNVPKGVKNDLGVSNVKELLAHYKVSKPSQFTGIADPNKPIVKGGFHFQGSELPEKWQTNFVADVKLMPLEMGKLETFDLQFEGQSTQSIEAFVYSPGQILIQRIKISDTDRPKTKFKTSQKSHTVPWTLVRKHILQQANNIKIDEFLTFLEHSFELFKKDIEKTDVIPHLDDILKTIKTLKSSSLPSHQWHEAISLMLFDYFTLYQMSESATYVAEEVIKSGRPLGHAEATKMKTLFNNELNLSEGNGLVDSPADVVAAAQGLLDVEINQTLTAQQWTNTIMHWMEALKTLFPTLMEKGYAEIVIAYVEEDLPIAVQTAEGTKTRKDLINKFHPGTFR